MVHYNYKALIRGYKQYELSNHLGNVLAVISDKRVTLCSSSVVSGYEADVMSATDYYAFGGQMVERTFSSPVYRYGFNGKEKIDEINGEGNEMDFGARIYNAKLSQFLSQDPLTAKYPYWSPYLFAANNPIKFIDIDGMGPGERFKTIDDAAKDFGKTYNDNSIHDGVEYGAVIYKVRYHGKKYYTYNLPTKGNKTNLGVRENKKPYFREVKARVHTHGNYIKKTDDEISVQDKAVIDNPDNYGVPLYVATPKGELLSYDPKTKKTRTVDSNMPSDPNDPVRVGDKSDPETLPKNEPYQLERKKYRDMKNDGVKVKNKKSKEKPNKK